MNHRATGAAALLGLLALAGCSDGPRGAGPRQAQPTVVVTSDPALDAARTSLTTSRKAVLADVSAVTAAATALDGIDTQAAKGAFDPARAAQPGAVEKAAAATAALAKLGPAVTAYLAAAKGLDTEAADSELSAAQAAALRSLAAASASEAASAEAFATGQSKGWGAYRQLVAAQALWITRAGAGYYPGTNNDLYDAQRAGEAYVVLVNPFRTALGVERRQLAAQSTAITTARSATEAALAAASTAFR